MSAASGGGAGAGGGAVGQGDPAVGGKLSTGDLDGDEMMLGFGDPNPGDGAQDGAQDGAREGEAMGFGEPSPGVQGGVQEGASQGKGGQGACWLHASGVGSALSVWTAWFTPGWAKPTAGCCGARLGTRRLCWRECAATTTSVPKD